MITLDKINATVNRWTGYSKPAATTEAPADDKTQQTIRGVQTHPTRMPVSPVVFSMDREFVGVRRQLAWNTVRDIEQNLSLLGWMVRLHLTYTSDFEFQPRTDDPLYNRELREWLEQRGMKKKVDVQRRFSLQEMFSTWAGLQVFDGYSAILKVEGGRLQLFEAWNMARGKGIEEVEASTGLKVNKDGVVLDEFNAIDWIAFATGDSSANLIHRCLAHHSEVILDGFSVRAADSLWESPILSILDKCRDYWSADEYNLMKAKIHAMFILVRKIKSEQKGGGDFPMYDGADSPTSASYAGGTQGTTTAPRPRPSPMGQLRSGSVVTVEPDEDYEMLESKTPSQEYVVFIKKVIADILLVLNIPYSFYDSSQANYSSMKADSVRYHQSCRPALKKNSIAYREGIRHLLRAGLTEDMPMWKGGFTVDTLPFALIPKSSWILDPAKELPATLSKLNACLIDHESACDELGSGNFFDIIDRIKVQREYAEAAGVKILLGNVTIRLTGDEDEEQDAPTAGTKTPKDASDE